MKEQNYKLILFGTGLYQEIELYGKNKDNVCIGTTKSCNIRLSRDNFPADFAIMVCQEGGKWKLTCSEEVYVTAEGMMRQSALYLHHGDELLLKCRRDHAEWMKLSFLIDFERMFCDYGRTIELPKEESITIGGKSFCNIHIEDELVGEDTISLVRNENSYTLRDKGTTYGVYINGFRMEGTEQELYDMDFFMLDGYSFYIRGTRLFASSSGTLYINGLREVKNSGQSIMEYPKFQRNVRICSIVPNENIEILAPAARKEKPGNNLLLSLIPAMVSMVLMVMLRSAMGGGGIFVIYSAVMMGMGIVTSVLTYVSNGKEYRRECKSRRQEYLQYARGREDVVRKLRKQELRILEEKYISMEEAIREAENFDSRLFERSSEDEDYLVVRVGTGTVPSNCQLVYKKQEFKDTQDELLDYPEKLADAYRYIQEAPVCIDLKETNAVGIVGNHEVQYEMLKIITIDLTVRHDFQDIKFYYLFDGQELERYQWLRWLRNVKNETGKIRNFMYDEESRKIILEVLYEELSGREGMKAEAVKSLPQCVVFVSDSRGFARHPVSNYVENCGQYGFHFLFFEEHMELLPKGCGKIVKLKEDFAEGEILNAENGEEKQSFTYQTIPNRTAEKLAHRLGCVCVEEVSLESTLTKHISLYELLGIVNIDNLDIAERWKHSRVYESMAAPLGVKSGEETVYLDLNEKHHGPHGLVAGTTGSGKSEILQSYILSMATLFHPYEVGFVIIDFKGGGMVNQFRELPHLIGAITNIDGKEIQRSLVSIQAELKKRQQLFAEYHVNHIDAYIKKYKAGETRQPLPHLILIVDEFAELKSSQPEFMKELISAARIGRSLGVHLILATQKPSGVVDDQIWSNSRFKLCLKVQNKEDSNEVLKSPLAAEIKEPGRAYFQVGNNEVFELFQSAYSGDWADVSQIGKMKEYKISEVNLLGRRKVIFEQKMPKSEKGQTQLEAVVLHIAGYCAEHGIAPLQGICLPALEAVIDYEYSKPQTAVETDIGTVIGIYDAPAQQMQAQAFVNFSQENIFVTGSSQYGKTNFLQVLVKGLASAYGPEEVNIYILDFASMILKTFEGLNHVGAVITSGEDEKLKNFFKMMKEEIYHRKDILSRLGISSFSSYRDAGYGGLAQIVIMTDNLTALKELYLQEEDDLLLICREGLAVGINVVVANSQTAGIGYRYLANFSKRIAFFCNDSGEYSNMFEACRMQPEKLPGRGILDIDRELYEFQAYLAFKGEKEVERVEEIKAFMKEINKRSSIKARKVPEIPNQLTRQYVMEQYGGVKTDRYQLIIGLDYSTVSTISLDLCSLGILGITGKKGSGKGNFIRYLLKCLNDDRENAPVKAVILDDISRKYKEEAELSIVETYTSNPEELGTVLSQWEQELKTRYEGMAAGEDLLYHAPLLLMVIQNQDALTMLQENYEWTELYKTVTTKYKAMKAAIILSEVPNANIAYSAPEPLKDVKESRHMMIFDEIANQKAIDIPLSAVREFKKRIEAGDCFYSRENEIRKIKSVLN